MKFLGMMSVIVLMIGLSADANACGLLDRLFNRSCRPCRPLIHRNHCYTYSYDYCRGTEIGKPIAPEVQVEEEVPPPPVNRTPNFTPGVRRPVNLTPNFTP